jgi:hypothetical protein
MIYAETLKDENFSCPMSAQIRYWNNIEIRLQAIIFSCDILNLEIQLNKALILRPDAIKRGILKTR